MRKSGSLKQFLALLPCCTEEAFNRLREHLEDDDGDMLLNRGLAARHPSSMPPGSDPGQWHDHVVKSGDRVILLSRPGGYY